MGRALDIVRRSAVRGTGASVASLLALLAASKRETGAPLAGVNAVSHWAWGDAAARRDGYSVAHTVVGALTNQAAAMFWAALYEPLFARRRRDPSWPRLAGEAAALSALACAVDYTITPKRFTPGYELRLSRRSLAGIYAAFAAGLALGSVMLPARDR